MRLERTKQAELAHALQTMAADAKVAEAETRARLTATVENLQAALYAPALAPGRSAAASGP